MIRLITMRRDGQVKREWTFVQLTRRGSFAFALDRYVELHRNPKTGRFKMIGKWERLDRRHNTIEPWNNGEHLKAELLEEITKELVICDAEAN